MISEREVVNLIEGLTIQRLRRWVEHGWIVPVQKSNRYVFTEIDVARLDLIRQLKTELAVNNAAIPIVLSLIDQVHGLRYELRSLASAVEVQENSVQKAILKARNKHGK